MCSRQRNGDRCTPIPVPFPSRLSASSWSTPTARGTGGLHAGRLADPAGDERRAAGTTSDRPELERIDLNAATDAMEWAATSQPLRLLPLVVLSTNRSGRVDTRPDGNPAPRLPRGPGRSPAGEHDVSGHARAGCAPDPSSLTAVTPSRRSIRRWTSRRFGRSSRQCAPRSVVLHLRGTRREASSAGLPCSSRTETCSSSLRWYWPIAAPVLLCRSSLLSRDRRFVV